MLRDLMVNSNYAAAALKQTAAERVPWRHDSEISSTCSIATLERRRLLTICAISQSTKRILLWAWTTMVNIRTFALND